MLVKRFKGNNIFGYLDFDISFNEDISFLVGGNGSGKTTSMKLMNALLTPNFNDLMQIPYNRIEIEISNQSKNIIISAETKSDTIELKISNSIKKINLPTITNIEFEYYSHKREKITDIVENINMKYSDHEIIKKISEIPSPIFLGLDRRRENSYRFNSNIYHEDMWLHNKSKRAINAKRMIKGSLGASLMETQLLVQNSYKRIRELEDLQSMKLRDSILLSAFQYSTLDLDSLEKHNKLWKEKSGFLKRQKEIKSALSKISGSDSELISSVDKFFGEITILFEQMAQSDKGLSAEWLLNKVQIERISKIVEIIDEHKAKVDQLFKPINDFLYTINSFYLDSNKELEINTVGQLTIKRPNGDKCSIEGLSSGERQLLVIFAHTFFTKSNVQQTFIIDEPELSLHISWQEKFTETIYNMTKKAQYILATHSPEIVAIDKSKAVRCR